jgi:hypothetical protein
MNLLDIAILLVFLVYLLAGYYRGFFNTMLSIGANIASSVLGMVGVWLFAAGVRADEGLYNMLLYYTEGAEYVPTVELANTPIQSLSSEQLAFSVSGAEGSALPFPIGMRISENVTNQAFRDMNVTTLGGYFNQTMVNVLIHILLFLAIFLLARIVCSFVIHGVDYAREGYPVLRAGDNLIGGGVGLIRGFLDLFVVCMIIPIILVVVPVPLVKSLLEGSFFCNFFYQSNFLLGLIPGA